LSECDRLLVGAAFVSGSAIFKAVEMFHFGAPFFSGPGAFAKGRD
jgi:hypothetical protein